jgi:hypothetical protein
LTYNELQSTLYHFNTFSTTVPHTFQCSIRIQSVPYTFHTPSAMFHTHSTVVHPRSTVFSTRYTVFHTNSTMFHSVPQCSTRVPQCSTHISNCCTWITVFHKRSTNVLLYRSKSLYSVPHAFHTPLGRLCNMCRTLLSMGG